MTRGQAGVKAVETSIRILTALASSERPQMLKDVARLANMHPAKAHRYLVSFVRQDLVRQDPESGRYMWGPRALDIGVAALRSVSFIRLAAIEAATLRDETGITAAVAVWGNRGPTHVLVEEPHRDVVTKSQIGSVLPLLTSATGRIFAAFLPGSTTKAMIEGELKELKKQRGRRMNSQADFDRLLADVRKKGIARVRGEYSPGVHALCCPVFEDNQRIVGALTVLAPAGQFDSDLNSPVARALRSATQRMSEALAKVKISAATP